MIDLRNKKWLLILGAVLLITISCEGPAGEDGKDGKDGADGLAGADGVDGNVTCMVCHNDETLAQTQYEFAVSQHSSGDIAVSYAGGRSYCNRCHSHEGFVAFASGFAPANVSNPHAWKCATCHNIHTTFEKEDYALRTTDAPALFDSDYNFLLKGVSQIQSPVQTIDVQGNSNLCANCHQSRRAEPNTASPGETFTITSTHYGPHHGAQANVLAGVGFAEIDGSYDYPTAESSTHLTGVSCVGCHMGEYEKGAGGHSFEPSVANCTDCHTGITNFDWHNVQTEMQALLDQLRDLLLDKGILEQDVEEKYEVDPETGDIVKVVTTGGYHPVKGTYDMTLVQAFFNWVGLEEDRSKGVHNPAYFKALLNNSIEAVEAL